MNQNSYDLFLKKIQAIILFIYFHLKVLFLNLVNVKKIEILFSFLIKYDSNIFLHDLNTYQYYFHFIKEKL